VACEVAGLKIIDVSNPASPTLLGTFDTPGYAYGIAITGTTAYVGDWGGGLRIIDVSNPASPASLGSYNNSGTATVWGVAVSGSVVWLVDSSTGARAIDVSNPASPTPLGYFDTPGNPRGVTVSGNAVYVADGSGGLQILNASNPSSATPVGSYDTPGSAYDVVLSGTRAYVADNSSNTLQILDVSNPASPALLGTFSTAPGIAVGVAVSGTLAYLGENDAGIQIVDVSNPASPNLLGSYNTPGFAYGIEVRGSVAYVADGTSGLQMFNVANPTFPTPIGSYDTPGFAIAVAVSGTVAYVADRSSGLQIINVSNPASPTLLGSYDTPDQCYAVAVSGTVAYVADGATGLMIFNVSNPASPTLIATYDTPAYALDVAVAGSIAVVADEVAGITVLDVSNPASPRVIGSYDTPGASTGLWLSGALAYVADAAPGLQILELFQNRFDRSRNMGRTLALDDTPDAIQKVRLTTTQVNSVTWDVSANGGVNWQNVSPAGGWYTLAATGSDLRWRASLAPVGLLSTAANPEASRAELEWLYTFPVVESIADIGNDQGRQVRLDWTRSSKDFVGAVPQILSYAIYRRVDPGAAPLAAPAWANPGGPDALVSGWDFVTSVPADADDEYAVVVPTVADSTVASGQHWSAFRVRALTATPGVFYDSYADSGYSKDNLVPAAPAALAVAYQPGSGNVLTWTNPTDEDFSHIKIYRANVAGFTPGPSNLVHTTNATTWTDAAPGAAYYKVTAVDESGNESNAASASQTVGVEGAATPIAFALHAAVPNPFALSTSFAYDVPASGGAVKLGVYDISGRMVRALVDGPQSAGRKTMTWDGRDDQGRALPVGLYMMRMQAAGFARMRKLVLTK
jgi:hypothetical protein